MSSDPDREEAASPLLRFLILKPVFGTLLTLTLCGGGLMAYRAMVKESLPDLAIPQATVQTEWPGADPESIELQITNKIEKKLRSLDGLKKMRSASFDGFSVIAVEFGAEADLDTAMRKLREKVDDAMPDLPSEVKAPRIQQVSVDDSPVLTVALSGDLPMAVLGRAGSDLKDLIEKVPGVNKVTLGGDREEVIQVRLIPSRLASLGISPTDVKAAIDASHLDMPWDKIESDTYGGTIRLYGRFRKVEDLRRLPIVRLNAGRVVRLEEIANVRRDLERETSRATLSFEGGPYERAVEIAVTKAPGADTLELIRHAKQALEEAQNSAIWPYGMQSRVTFDQSIDIWQRLLSVFDNGWQAMLAVFLILLLMLTWREALVAGLSIPITFLGGLALIWALGYTLNQMVIIGMVLALGMLVDVFILMMEGMHEGLFVQRLTFSQAAIKTIRTYSLPALTGQATTILAMAPLMAISGVDGKFIRIIPVTAICCLVLSYIVALLVSVPLSRLVLGKLKGTAKETWIDRLNHRLGDAFAGWLSRVAVHTKLRAVMVVVACFALFFGTLVGMGMLPSLLYPKSDGRKLGLTVELSAETTLSRSQECADALGEILREKPYFESVMKFVGQKSPFSQNSIGESLSPTTGSYIVGFSCMYTPLEERDFMAFESLEGLREELDQALRDWPGSRLVLTPETGGASTEDPIQIELSGEDMDELRSLSKRVQHRLQSIAGTTDVRDNLGPSRIDYRMIPRREALDFYGISSQELAAQVRIAMTDDEIGLFQAPGVRDELGIRLGMAWPSRDGQLGGPSRGDELAMVRAFDSKGRPTSVLALATPVVGMAPLSITRKDGRRAVTVMAKTEGRTPQEVLADLDPILIADRTQWPPGYDYHFGGAVESAEETFSSAAQMLGVALFLVFAVLVLQFSSFLQPVIILLTVPLALIGTFGGFFLAWIPFSFPAMIGVISLVGIAVNNAIVMIETMNEHVQAGKSIREAASRGAADRLRPIVTTSLTTVVGLIPLALSDPMWMPLCSAIIFGLGSSTVISLVAVPCLFLLLTRTKGVSC